MVNGKKLKMPSEKLVDEYKVKYNGMINYILRNIKPLVLERQLVALILRYSVEYESKLDLQNLEVKISELKKLKEI